MLRVKYPIIVEGKYDKIKLSSIVDTDIYTTGGFSIFKDTQKQKFFQSLAKKTKLILLTDSDTAGFKIRGFLAGLVPTEQIIHLYIPEVFGKERRKLTPSAEGFLGVEGINADILEEEFKKANVLIGDEEEKTIPSEEITKMFLYEIGLSGRDNSAELRRAVLKELNLPQKMSSSSMCKVLNRYTSREELIDIINNKIKYTF